MTSIIFTAIILSSLTLIGLILIQNPKSNTNMLTSAIGAKKATPALSKTTWILSIGIFGLTLIMGAL